MATLLGPAPASPAPPPWRNARDPFRCGRCSKCPGGGGKVYPLNEAPVCTAEEGGLGEGEARLLPPPHHSEPQTSIPEQPPLNSRERGPLQRVEGTCLWSHRAVIPQPPHASHLSRDVPKAGLIF